MGQVSGEHGQCQIRSLTQGRFQLSFFCMISAVMRQGLVVFFAGLQTIFLRLERLVFVFHLEDLERVGTIWKIVLLKIIFRCNEALPDF